MNTTTLVRPNSPSTHPSQAPVSPDPALQRILDSGMITPADRTWLLYAALADTLLTPAQVAQIRQVFDRLQMGLLRVVD